MEVIAVVLMAVVPVVVSNARPLSVLLNVVTPAPEVLVFKILLPPVTVLSKETLPLPLEKVVVPVNVTGPFKVRELVPDVATVPLALMEPVD